MNKPQVFYVNSVHFALTRVLFSAILFFSGCTSFPLVGSDIYLTPVPEETLQAYELNQPVGNQLEAVMAAHYALQTTRIEPVETPQVIYAEKMTLQAALDRIDPEGKESNVAHHSSALEAWLVVYKGKWRLLTPVGDYTETQDACAYVALKSEDGDSVSIGLSVCEKIDLSR